MKRFEDLPLTERIRLYVENLEVLGVTVLDANPAGAWLPDEEWYVYRRRGVFTLVAVTVLLVALGACGAFDSIVGPLYIPFCYVAAAVGWGYAVFERYMTKEEA